MVRLSKTEHFPDFRDTFREISKPRSTVSKVDFVAKWKAQWVFFFYYGAGQQLARTYLTTTKLVKQTTQLATTIMLKQVNDKVIKIVQVM